MLQDPLLIFCHYRSCYLWIAHNGKNNKSQEIPLNCDIKYLYLESTHIQKYYIIGKR